MIKHALKIVCFVVHVALALRKSVDENADDWKALFEATTLLLHYATGRFVGSGPSSQVASLSLSEELALAADQTFFMTRAKTQLSEQAAQRSCLAQDKAVASESATLARHCLDQITTVQWAEPMYERDPHLILLTH